MKNHSQDKEGKKELNEKRTMKKRREVMKCGQDYVLYVGRYVNKSHCIVRAAGRAFTLDPSLLPMSSRIIK